MRQNALKARPRRRGLPKDAGERSVIGPNVFARQFYAERPNQILGRRLHLHLDGGRVALRGRRVVGWSMNASMTAQLVTNALIMAIRRRGKRDALLHHADQGSQYTSEQFQRLMTDHSCV
jgi:putative transposase